MSNCIQFTRNNVVRFTEREIDVDKFAEFVTSAKENSTPESNLAWWFLQTNTKITRGNTASVEIAFGDGRSIHTNRDFKGTLQILSTFMKETLYHTFYITDEFDGHQQEFKIPVDLKTGKGLL